jgi:hypothetical protein
LENNNHSWFAVIPAEILLSKKLSSTKKLLVALISNLSSQKGYCFASNDYLSECLDISKTSVSTLLTELEKAGILERIIKRDKKKQIISRTIRLKFATPILKNQKTGILKNQKDNKNIFNKGKEEKVNKIKI